MRTARTSGRLHSEPGCACHPPEESSLPPFPLELEKWRAVSTLPLFGKRSLYAACGWRLLPFLGALASDPKMSQTSFDFSFSDFSGRICSLTLSAVPWALPRRIRQRQPRYNLPVEGTLAFPLRSIPLQITPENGWQHSRDSSPRMSLSDFAAPITGTATLPGKSSPLDTFRRSEQCGAASVSSMSPAVVRFR